jgi:hypothetical protein
VTLAAAALLSARDYAIASNAELRARALAEGFEVYFTMPEDEAYWDREATEYNIVTGADVIRRDAIQCYSDTYKEIYSIRPSWVNFDGIETDRIGEMLTELQDQASESDWDDDATDWDAIADADEDMSLTEQEEDEDLRRTLPAHLIQAWGL